MVLQLNREPNYALRLEVVDVLPQLKIQLLVLFPQDLYSTLLYLQTLLEAHQDLVGRLELQVPGPPYLNLFLEATDVGLIVLLLSLDDHLSDGNVMYVALIGDK